MHIASKVVIDPSQESLVLAVVERIVLLHDLSQALLSKLRLPQIFFQKHLLLVKFIVSTVHAQQPELLGLHHCVALDDSPRFLGVQYAFILPCSSLLAFITLV